MYPYALRLAIIIIPDSTPSSTLLLQNELESSLPVRLSVSLHPLRLLPPFLHPSLPASQLHPSVMLLQNDLVEFFTLMDIAVPGLLGVASAFRKHYEIPILRSQDADATDADVQASVQVIRS